MVFDIIWCAVVLLFSIFFSSYYYDNNISYSAVFEGERIRMLGNNRKKICLNDIVCKYNNDFQIIPLCNLLGLISNSVY